MRSFEDEIAAFPGIKPFPSLAHPPRMVRLSNLVHDIQTLPDEARNTVLSFECIGIEICRNIRARVRICGVPFS